jgi:IS30 family transposase
MSEKRRQFLELLAQGWSVRGACRELGIDRSSGNTWPPLEPLSVRIISPRFLSEDERVQIADLARRGLGPTAIG